MAETKQNRDNRCIAYVSNAWSSYRCRNMAYTEVDGYRVCGTHARLARKWKGEGKLAAMIQFWWKG